MPRFFTGPIEGQTYTIVGEDASHIAKSLRMAPGEALTLCDGQGFDYRCEIRGLSSGSVQVEVLEKHPNQSEPSVRFTLYQGLPKSDKMDLIVQKAVELGISSIVPMQTSRCVSRPDAKSMEKKRQRWQKIALEAAKQSGRGSIPQVLPLTDFSRALEQAAQDELCLFFYEGGGAPLRTLASPSLSRCSLLVGPEGGFAPEEVALAQSAGAQQATLGPRILRTETAPLAALSALLYATGNMD